MLMADSGKQHFRGRLYLEGTDPGQVCQKPENYLETAGGSLTSRKVSLQLTSPPQPVNHEP